MMSQQQQQLQQQPVAAQLVLYHNDAVEVSYSDGSWLQVAPCGAAFVYHQPPGAGEHPLYGEKRIQQRSQFVTSSFKPLLQEALDFRNRLAQRPYLCAAVIEPETLIKLHADIFEVGWPGNLSTSDTECFPDGSVKVTSRGEHASVTLAPSQQMFSVQYLCKLSQPVARPTLSGGQNERAFNHETTAYRDSQQHRSQSTEGTQSKAHNLQQLSSDLQDFLKPSRGSSQEAEEKLPDYKSDADNRQGGMEFGIPPAVCSRDQLISDAAANLAVAASSSATSEARWSYAWVVQHFSVEHYPACWRHALQLLLQFVDEKTKEKLDRTPGKKRVHISDELVDIDLHNAKHRLAEGKNPDPSPSSPVRSGTRVACTENDDDGGPRGRDESVRDVYSNLPKSLPLNCQASHLHKFKAGMDEANKGQGQVKVICSQGIIYNLHQEPSPRVEIYPGDGSVIRSAGPAGHYFTHYLYSQGELQEKMYSVQHPPPEVASGKYPVGKLIAKAARFLQQLCAENLQRVNKDEEICWQVPGGQSVVLTDSSPAVQLEECTVDGVGRFTARSDGRIRVVFCDRTSLDLQADLSKRAGHCRQHSEEPQPEATGSRPRTLSACYAAELPSGTCRLLLRNGHYENVALTEPGKYQKYVQAALEWVSWVNCSPSDRYLFYKDTMHDPEKQGTVASELKKIHCFNYIVENTVLPQFKSGAVTDSQDQSKVKVSALDRPICPSLEELGYGIHSDAPHISYPTYRAQVAQCYGDAQHLNSNVAMPAVPRVITGTGTNQQCLNAMADSLATTRALATDNPGSWGHVPCAGYLSGSAACSMPGSSADGLQDFSSIQDILQRTSRTIQDLDSFLEVNGETRSFRDSNYTL